jgi:hypothetical protein
VKRENARLPPLQEYDCVVTDQESWRRLNVEKCKPGEHDALIGEPADEPHFKAVH